ncbi:galactosyltransferase-domain-containing protein [Choanephora cucurbitarum]|nr:galactosyltransferase-domain-containing protein [Choanephora cucurbitarum]
MSKANKQPKTPRFYFWRKTLSLSDLNLPRGAKITIDALRTLSLIPSFIGFLYNSQQALHVPFRDAGGAIILQSSQIDYIVASFWCALAGYWNWILTTSMMRRWIFHYEISSAIVRLITFIVITWSISAWVSTRNGPEQPIRTWMINCFILLITDIVRLSIVSDPKYHGKTANVKDPNLFLKLTIMKVLIFPMSVATCLSVFAVLYQIDQLQYTTSQLMVGSPLFSQPLQPSITPSVLVLIVSSWSDYDRRQMLRKSSLRLLSSSHMQVNYRFVIGQPPSARQQLVNTNKILKEVEAYHDLILVQASDRPEDKSRKVLAALEWAESMQQDFVIKTEDDVFVRWDTVLTELEQHPSQHDWKGSTWRNIPLRMAEKSLQIDYALPMLPAYTHSMFYILSKDTLRLIVSPHSIRRFIRDDGKNIAIWLFGFYVKPIHDKRIQDDRYVCEDDMIAKRVHTLSEMAKMYFNIANERPQCFGLNPLHCAVCYPCQGKRIGWRTLHLDCDEHGIYLREMSGFPQLVQ